MLYDNILPSSNYARWRLKISQLTDPWSKINKNRAKYLWTKQDLKKSAILNGFSCLQKLTWSTNSTAPPTLTISTIILYNYISTVFFFHQQRSCEKNRPNCRKKQDKIPRPSVRHIPQGHLTIRKEHWKSSTTLRV